jgi:hypothetical protein
MQSTSSWRVRRRIAFPEGHLRCLHHAIELAEVLDGSIHDGLLLDARSERHGHPYRAVLIEERSRRARRNPCAQSSSELCGASVASRAETHPHRALPTFEPQLVIEPEPAAGARQRDVAARRVNVVSRPRPLHAEDASRDGSVNDVVDEVRQGVPRQTTWTYASDLTRTRATRSTSRSSARSTFPHAGQNQKSGTGRRHVDHGHFIHVDGHRLRRGRILLEASFFFVRQREHCGRVDEGNRLRVHL